MTDQLDYSLNAVIAERRPWPGWLKPVSISGVEVTQAIQYYDARAHLTDPADRGTDNSVPLVMAKPAWIRVYVNTLFGPTARLRGRLLVSRANGWLPFWVDEAPLTPLAPGVVTTAADAYADERGSLGSTLNFLLPAARVSGRLRLRAEIWRDGDPGTVLDTRQVSVNAQLEQTLAVRAVLVGYNGPAANGTPMPAIPAPTVAQLAQTGGWALRCMPVSSTGSFSSAGTVTWATPLTGVATAPGGCSLEWLALNAAIAAAKTADGNRTDVIYYGLLPNGVPMANVIGCASSGVTSGAVFDGVTLAHEVGHFCGLPHAPCGTPGDTTYPAYEPYDLPGVPNASLGEYGLDVTGSALRRPAQKDLMSYCGGDWFGLHNYRRLWQNTALRPRWHNGWKLEIPRLVDPYVWPWELWQDDRLTFPRREPRPLISVIAVLDDDRIDVRSVMRLTAVDELVGAVASRRHVVQLLGESGDVVVETPLMVLPSRGCGGGCGGSGGDQQRGGCGGGCGGTGGGIVAESRGPRLVQALLPDVEPGTALRIVARGRRGEEDRELWTRRAPAEPSSIRGFDVDIDGDHGRARWELVAAERDGDGAERQLGLQFTKDDGRSWNALATAVPLAESPDGLEFDASWLPSGALRFRLLLHDGFATATAESSGVKVPRKPALLAVLHPEQKAVIPVGMPLRLHAWADSLDGEAVEKASWELDGESVGEGLDVTVPAPGAGPHTAIIIVGGRNPGRQVVEFETVDDGSLG